MLHTISTPSSDSTGHHSEQSHPALKITCKQGFYITLPILHGLSAIAALVICFHCNVGQMQHQARIPRAPDPKELGPALLPANYSQVKLFLAAYRWAEDAEFTTHTWNPFALTMVFQWLTAGFALRNIAPLAQEGILATVWYVWLVAGYGVFVTWSFVQTKAFCVAMFATVTVCFMASALICFLALGPPKLCTLPHGKKGSYEEVPQQHSDARLSRINGRLWVVPPTVRSLKQYPSLQGNGYQRQPPHDVWTELEQVWGVFFRYAEYCVTAPLLFLAVVCLLVVDAPAWLFLTGYWMVLACNLFGIPLHYNFLVLHNNNNNNNGDALKAKHRTGGVGWLARLLLSNQWGSNDSGLWYNLEAAWIAILVPVSGLVYLTRNFLLDFDMPLIALFMIWNLLITYLMFGIVPTFVYVTGWGRRQLPWLLDILNVAAKFPLPIVIIVGFITRPVTFRPCITS